jgi:hypothetical protein
MVLTSSQRADQQSKHLKTQLLDYFLFNSNETFTLNQLEAKFNQPNLVSVLNDLLAEGDIIQVRNLFRMPYTDESEEEDK